MDECKICQSKENLIKHTFGLTIKDEVYYLTPTFYICSNCEIQQVSLYEVKK